MTNVAPVTFTTAVGTSKAAVAREIFDAAYCAEPVPARKDILELVCAVTDLTVAGASTYLQNYKSKHGLTAQK